MIKIPDFLRPENIKSNPTDDKMWDLMEKYKEHFGNYPTTVPAPYSTEQWIDILNECIEKNITVFEKLPGELETGDEHEHDCIIIVE